MVKCPKCNKEIDYLSYTQKCVAHGVYNGDEYDEYSCDLADDEENLFYCPECEELLFEDEDDASDFLNGGNQMYININIENKTYKQIETEANQKVNNELKKQIKCIVFLGNIARVYF